MGNKIPAEEPEEGPRAPSAVIALAAETRCDHCHQAAGYPCAEDESTGRPGYHGARFIAAHAQGIISATERLAVSDDPAPLFRSMIVWAVPPGTAVCAECGCPDPAHTFACLTGQRRPGLRMIEMPGGKWSRISPRIAPGRFTVGTSLVGGRAYFLLTCKACNRRVMQDLMQSADLAGLNGWASGHQCPGSHDEGH